MGEPNCLFTRATNVPFLLSTRLFFPGVYDLLMRPTLDLIYPFTGMWMAKNSPRDRVPSHGTSLFASEMAIDFLPVDECGRTAPFQLRSLFTPERPEDFPGFGRLLRAPAAGEIVAIKDDVPDHPTYRGFPSVKYALTQSQHLAEGWPALAGNHVMIDTGAAVVALCHVQRGSVLVKPGDHVDAGVPFARCGNSGNSMQPHVHVQAMNSADPKNAKAIPIAFDGELPRNGEIISVT